MKHIVLFANATLALITALQALRVTGEVITTPYSFVATSHALLWNGLKPIFVDIDQDSMNLDPSRIGRRSPRRPPRSCRCIATATPAMSRRSSGSPISTT